ncbi:MAG: RtcB family protein [Myxococcota bacterium]
MGTINTETLPSHARLIADEDVWIEGAAIDQLARVASMSGCAAAVGLPDLHPGPGIPIGAAFAFTDQIRPGLVGSDAGCGVRVVAFPKLKQKGDALERRVLAAFDDEDVFEGASRRALTQAAWTAGPRGLASVSGAPETLAELAAAEPEEDDWMATIPSAPLEDVESFTNALGTIGGGNHFLEVSAVSQVSDKAVAKSLGLKRGGFAVVAHSGSRGIGRALIGRWGDACLSDPDAQRQYLGELAGAVRFARANRLVLAWRMLAAVGAARRSRISGQFDVTHNVVVPWASQEWLHRKGSAPAEAGQPTIVLGSRGTESWVMEGLGARGCLCSVAHGAGRRMNRGEAIEKLKSRYRRAELTRTALGGRVICADKSLLYAEHPDAYKDIEPVVRSLEAEGAARRIAALAPRVTVKR